MLTVTSRICMCAVCICAPDKAHSGRNCSHCVSSFYQTNFIDDSALVFCLTRHATPADYGYGGVVLKLLDIRIVLPV